MMFSIRKHTVKTFRKHEPKICLVSSSGGHLFKSFQLKKWWSKYDRFWVTKDDGFATVLLKDEKKYFAYFPESRSIFNFFRNLLFAHRILKKEKPDLLFSTGAGVAPPFFFVAKLLGIKTIFMETLIFTPQPTLSGKMLYPIADYFLVQNKKLLEVYPKARYWGRCL